MIAIRYSGNQLPKLDSLCKYLQKKVGVWVTNGAVGNAGTAIRMNDETKRFFILLNRGGSISKLVNMPASKIEGYIDLIEKHIPQLAADRAAKELNPQAGVSDLYKCIYIAFSNFGYDSDKFPAEELMKDLDLTVCPYCNRNFIKTIQVRQNAAGKDIFVKGQLDHFYPRSLYPYLAICKHNLVPSCASCNGASGKHDDDTRTKGVVNPFLLADSNGLKFKMTITGKGVADLNTCAQTISIDVDCTANPALANNEDIFHLKKLYTTHTDYAAEVYYKSILRTPHSYKQYIGKKMIAHGMKYSDADFERLLLGTYTREEDYHKRPLSKFCADIARQRKLIP